MVVLRALAAPLPAGWGSFGTHWLYAVEALTGALLVVAGCRSLIKQALRTRTGADAAELIFEAARILRDVLYDAVWLMMKLTVAAWRRLERVVESALTALWRVLCEVWRAVKWAAA